MEKETINKMLNYLGVEYISNWYFRNVPCKEVIADADNTAIYTNRLRGEDRNGIYATKTIDVNEDTGRVSSETTIKTPFSDRTEVFDSALLTIFRTGLNALFAALNCTKTSDIILFIGGGRINLVTAKLLSMYGYKNMCLIGGRNNADKEIARFENATGLKFNQGKIQKATVIISCTNNNDLESRYSINAFPLCRVHITSDTGYALDESFRAGIPLFSDCPYHLESHSAFEFPGETAKYHFMQIAGVKKHKSKKAGVYLYGNIYADIISCQYRNEITEFINELNITNKSKME